MAGEPKTELDKALRALLLLNLGSMKQKRQKLALSVPPNFFDNAEKQDE